MTLLYIIFWIIIAVGIVFSAWVTEKRRDQYRQIAPKQLRGISGHPQGENSATGLDSSRMKDRDPRFQSVKKKVSE